MLILLLSLLIVPFKSIDAQVISHELRRLSASTNQFGIDALRALDRIEPPDKVLVFCPICLSSSLVMIMMGSSRNPVVSSLRHALYVWSMMPQEVNKGFKDIFEHIGLNQQIMQQSSLNNKARNVFAATDDVELVQESSLRRSWARKGRGQRSSDHGVGMYRFSLPMLMRFRDHHDQENKSNLDKPWWLQPEEERKNSSRNFRERNRTRVDYSSYTRPIAQASTVSRSDIKDINELSQMSATSNIYIQRGLFMNYDYNLLLRQHYKTVIHPVDFNRHAEETRQHINSIVSSSTEGKVKDLIRKGTFEAWKNTKVMIISTFHFRGTLDIQMKDKLKRSRTSDALTTSIDLGRADQTGAENQNFIETEDALVKYGLFPELECSVIEIPFSNRLVSLVIVMPNHLNSTEFVLTKLSAQVLADMIRSLEVKRMSIEIPIIKFDRGPINVAGLLKELGLFNIFYGDEVHSRETGLNRWMRPSDIIHETSIDIGTVNPNWNQPEDRLKVGAHLDRDKSGPRNRRHDDSIIRLDKSFFYFVLDSINGSILTMGRIRQ